MIKQPTIMKSALEYIKVDHGQYIRCLIFGCHVFDIEGEDYSICCRCGIKKPFQGSFYGISVTNALKSEEK